ncbi:MAG TPA: arsenic resistance N-acetyltransferase ArsN2 [Kaistiaceae bacterium]|nr:arsenic resistance N-acetyltransferase ArsN2 [Kaistiaceae bacterium]
MMTKLAESPLAETDRPALAAMLREAGLPADDIGEPGRAFFLYRDESGRIVGCGGLEGSGSDLLLRSVAILPERRGEGLGGAIVAWLEARAAAAGCRRLWLLTTTADGFFARIGYAPAERTTAPETIAATRQFAGLCPSSARLMCRVLAASNDSA